MGAPSTSNIVWPDSFGVRGPTDPRLYALALQLQGGGLAGQPGAAPDADPSPDGALSPSLMAARVLAAYNAAHPTADMARFAQDAPTGAAAMADADADASDPDDAAPMTGAQDALAAQSSDAGAVPASSVAEPAAAQVATNGPSSQPASPALDPADQLLRPELSGGPDPLVAALAGQSPNDNPFGLIVDPTTGSVSHLRFDVGGDPLNPNGPTLEPATPQEKQSYLEWLTGARANYPLGAISPEEQNLRQMQSAPAAQGRIAGGSAGRRPQPHPSPGGVRYTTDQALTPSQQGILDNVVDTGRRLGMSPDLIHAVANQAYYESSPGRIRTNPAHPNTKGLFQYKQGAWDQNSRPDHLDINSDDDQIGLMYRDAARYKAQYGRAVANGALRSPLSFEQYVELNHHMGDHALQKGKTLPSDFNKKVAGFGLRILNLPLR
jgi:hypothetical protein